MSVFFFFFFKHLSTIYRYYMHNTRIRQYSSEIPTESVKTYEKKVFRIYENGSVIMKARYTLIRLSECDCRDGVCFDGALFVCIIQIYLNFSSHRNAESLHEQMIKLKEHSSGSRI